VLFVAVKVATSPSLGISPETLTVTVAVPPEKVTLVGETENELAFVPESCNVAPERLDVIVTTCEVEELLKAIELGESDKVGILAEKEQDVFELAASPKETWPEASELPTKNT